MVGEAQLAVVAVFHRISYMLLVAQIVQYEISVSGHMELCTCLNKNSAISVHILDTLHKFFP